MMVQMDCANIEINANDRIKCAYQTRNHVHKTLSDQNVYAICIRQNNENASTLLGRINILTIFCTRDQTDSTWNR